MKDQRRSCVANRSCQARSKAEYLVMTELYSKVGRVSGHDLILKKEKGVMLISARNLYGRDARAQDLCVLYTSIDKMLNGRTSICRS